MEGLQWVGVTAACAAAGASLVIRDPRARAAAMVLALVLAPTLIAGDVWDTERFRDLRDSPAQLGALAVAGVIGISALTALILRVAAAFPLLAFGVLAFRIPVELGGETSNLLIPLYLVIASGVAATAIAAWRRRHLWVHPQPRDGGGESERTSIDDSSRASGLRPLGGHPGGLTLSRARRASDVAARVLPWLLASFLMLYALQSAYSSDLSKATETVAFFLIPFAVMLALLLEVRWTSNLLTALFAIVFAEGLLFVAVGAIQFATRDLFWNPTLISGNEVHVFFRVNSLFWDPNVFGRYLILAVLAAVAYMVWTERSERAIAAAVGCVVLIAGLTLSFSQSSIFALLAGLVVLVALRWGLRWALGVGGVLAIAAVGTVLAAGVEPTSSRSLEVRSSGRVTLIKGGLELAGDRPVLGYGSGSFQNEFAQRYLDVEEPEGGAISHSEPVTVAAEQGGLGLIVYGALVVAGLVALLGAAPLIPAPRGALVACFVAMIVHSLAYAGFLTDPVTWGLLGVGLALARAPTPSPLAERASRPAPESAPRARPSLASPGASSGSPGS
jgi:putative inorganic carbon (HCO3(-)) transporter